MLDTIVIHAQKRTENAADFPGSVALLSGEALEVGPSSARPCLPPSRA